MSQPSFEIADAIARVFVRAGYYTENGWRPPFRRNRPSLNADTCHECGAAYEPTRGNSKYCSGGCKYDARRRTTRAARKSRIAAKRGSQNAQR